MSALRTAAQQALEALEIGYDSAQAEAHQFHAAMAGYKPQRHAEMDADVQKIAAAITALRAALPEPTTEDSSAVEPVQEPVAWSYELATTMLEHGYDGWEHRITRYKPNVPEGSIRNLTPLYTAPPQRPAEPVQEPVAWMVYTLDGKSVCVTDNPADFIEWRSLPLYAAPPQRKPLTEEEIDALELPPSGTATVRDLVRLIERAHGITS